MNNILLSICIPTYNRSFFLNRCLFYVTNQIETIKNKLEIVVIDNDSNDETFEVVQKYIDLDFPIVYIKNDYNLGPDVNVDKCYQIARGKYVLALGDDDIIVLNSLNKLLRIINQSDYGVIHLTAMPIESDMIYKLEKDKLNFKIFSNHNDFFNKVGYNITFISTNIVNKKYYDISISSKYLGSSLPQVPFIARSILKANQNLIIKDTLVRAQVDNSGGYNLLKVFGINFYNILFDISKEFPDSKIFQIINNKLLTYFFPFWIVKLKNDINFEKFEKPNLILMPLYKKNLRFWFFCFPLDYMPYKMAFIYNFATHIPHKIKKIFFLIYKSLK